MCKCVLDIFSSGMIFLFFFWGGRRWGGGGGFELSWIELCSIYGVCTSTWGKY